MEQKVVGGITIPNFDLTGKVAVVTGGTKGLGRGMALTLASYGADVVVTSRHQDECDKVAGEIKALGRRGLGIACDVTQVGQIDTMIEAAAEQLGKVDIVICNAGSAVTVKALDMTEADWDHVCNVDLKGVAFTGRAAARQMVKQGGGGKIINIASAAGLVGQRGISIYCAAKAAVINLTRAQAAEWVRYGITANAVCPGYVLTGINEAAMQDPKGRKAIESFSLLGRLGKIEEIAAQVLYMASDYSGFMTGSAVVIDGGGSAT